MWVPDRVTLICLGVALYLKAGRVKNQLLTGDIRSTCVDESRYKRLTARLVLLCNHGMHGAGRCLSSLLGPGATISGY